MEKISKRFKTKTGYHTHGLDIIDTYEKIPTMSIYKSHPIIHEICDALNDLNQEAEDWEFNFRTEKACNRLREQQLKKENERLKEMVYRYIAWDMMFQDYQGIGMDDILWTTIPIRNKEEEEDIVNEYVEMAKEKYKTL